jgi:hypothetical protein
VLNVEEEAIEVINCKLIWMPAGNKKKTRDYPWVGREFSLCFLKEKKRICSKEF